MREALVNVVFVVACLTLALVALLLIVAPLFAGEPIRIDTYDTHANRTGYATIDPQTGRVDTFDKYSRRTGSGQIMPPPAPTFPTTTSSPTPATAPTPRPR